MKDDVEICLTCGEAITYWYVIEGSVIFECYNCENHGWDEGLDNEQPCLCREDTINPFCPCCF